MAILLAPVISSFDGLVPESHFDSVLKNVVGHCTRDAMSSTGQQLQPKMRPLLFSFEQLATIISSAAEYGFNSTIDDVRVLSKNLCQFGVNCGYRISTCYLRYLLWMRHDQQNDKPFDAVKINSNLHIQMKRALDRHVHSDCEVDLLQIGGISDSFYTGMWFYQCKRIDHLIRQIVGTNERRRISAKIAVVKISETFELRVGFFSGATPVEDRDYVLRTRPCENQIRCVERLIRRINAAGIRATVCECGNCSFSVAIGNGRTNKLHPRIAMPI